MVIDIMNKTKIKRLIIAFLSVAAVVLFGMIFTKGTYDFYDTLVKPELAPKAIVFPIAWSIIYFLLALTLYFCFENKKIVFFLMLNLVINVIWPILFFKFELLLVSIYWLILLILSLIHLLYLLYKENKKLVYLNLPYMFWCFFALYLNILIYLINR